MSAKVMEARERLISALEDAGATETARIMRCTTDRDDWWVKVAVRAIEAADKARVDKAVAQEPVAEVVGVNGRSGVEIRWLVGPVKIGDKLYTAPPAQDVPEDVRRDAERYRWLRSETSPAAEAMFRPDEDFGFHALWGDELDAAIDAAMKEANDG